MSALRLFVMWSCICVVFAEDPPRCVGSVSHGTSVAVWDEGYVALRTDGSLWNSSGPERTPGGSGYRAIANQAGALLWAVGADGAALRWGSSLQTNGPVVVHPGPFQKICAGAACVLGLTEGGDVIAIDGVLALPADLGAVRDIAVSPDGWTAMAVRVDGTLAAWSSYAGHLTPPAGLHDVVRVVLGDAHAVALLADGSVTCWGRNDDGESSAPVGLHDVVEIGAGDTYSVAVLRDGRIEVWGGYQGQPYATPASPDDVVGISCRGRATALLRRDGTVLFTTMQPSGYPWPFRAWAREGDDAAMVVVLPAIASAEVVVPLTARAADGEFVIPSSVAVPAGERFATVSVRVEPIVAGGPKTARVYAAAAIPPDGTWEEGLGSWIFGIDTAPRLSVQLSPTGVTRISRMGWEAIAAFAADGTGWALGRNTGSMPRLPPAGTVACVYGGDGSNAIALTADGSILASWRSWLPVCGPGSAVRLVEGQPRYAIRADASLFQVQTGEIVASSVTAAVGLSSEVYTLGTDGVVRRLSDGSAVEGLGLCSHIAAGDAFLVGLHPDGTVAIEEFGYHRHGMDVPAGLADVTAIAAGPAHILVLCSGGTVRAWGADMGPETSIPPGLPPATAVAACYGRSAVLLQDGSVVRWPADEGDDAVQIAEGEQAVVLVLADAAATERLAPTVTVSVPDLATIATPPVIEPGSGFAAVPLTAETDADSEPDRIFVSLAPGGGYQVAAGGFAAASITEPQAPVASCGWSPTDVREVVTCGTAVACLLADGRISVWGVTSRNSQLDSLLMHDNGLHGIALTDESLLGITADGLVREIPLSQWPSGTPAPADLTQVVRLVGGYRQSVALSADGTVRSWGTYGVPAGLTDVIDVSVCAGEGIALHADGSVSVWTSGSVLRPDLVPADLPSVASVRAGGGSFLVLLRDGTVRTWGDWWVDQRYVPAGLDHVVAIEMSGNRRFALRDDGSVVAWGQGSDGYPQRSPSGWPRMRSIVASSALLGLTEDGMVLVEAGAQRETVAGPTRCREGDRMALRMVLDRPAAQDEEVEPILGGSPGVLAVADQMHVRSGSAVAIALVDAVPDPTDADSQSGSAGIPDLHGMSSGSAAWPLWAPSLVILDREPSVDIHLSPMGLRKVAVGEGCLVGLRQDGSVLVWGSSALSSTMRSAALPDNVLDVAVGGDHAVLLRSDGTVSAIGYNGHGQCNVPPGLTGCVAVSAGPTWSMALRGDGTVLAWGSGLYGNPVSAPAGLHDVVALAAGRGLGAILSDGTVVLWGTYMAGIPLRAPARRLITGVEWAMAVLDDGTIQHWGNLQYIGEPPAGLQDVRDVAVEEYASVALHADGHVTAWGMVSEHLQVGRLAGIQALSAGGYQVVALDADGAVEYIHGNVGETTRYLRDGEQVKVSLTASEAVEADMLIPVAWSGMPTQEGEITGPSSIALHTGGTHGEAVFQIGPDDDASTDVVGVRVLAGAGYGANERARSASYITVMDRVATSTVRVTLSPSSLSVNEGGGCTATLAVSAPFAHDIRFGINVAGAYSDPVELGMPADGILLPAGDSAVSIPITVPMDADADNDIVYVGVVDERGFYPYPAMISLVVWEWLPVACEANDGSGRVAQLAKRKGVPLSLVDAPNFDRDGMQIVSWNTAADGSGAGYAPDASYATDAAITLFAQWGVAVYHVAYASNGGSGSEADALKTHGADLVLSDGAGFGRTGHELAGWNSAADGTGTPFALGSVYAVNASAVLYAQWSPLTYEIRFDANAGDGSMPSEEHDYGSMLTLPPGTAFGREGFQFAGWSLAADGSGEVFGPGVEIQVHGSLTWFAQWSRRTYAITYEPNGGIGSEPAGTKIHGQAATLATGAGMLWTGYALVGWNSQPDGSGVPYAAGGAYLADVDVVLYAQWEHSRFSIVYDGNGGEGAPSATSKEYGIAVMLATGEGMSRAGYEFAGWDTQAQGGGTPYAAGDPYAVDAPVVLYAQWRPIDAVHGGGDSSAASGAQGGCGIGAALAILALALSWTSARCGKPRRM